MKIITDFVGWINSVLLIAFICGKISGIIGWSWTWILSPLWIGIIFVALIFIFKVGIGFLIFTKLVKNKK